MTSKEIKERLKILAIDVGNLSLSLAYSELNKIYSRQIIRSSSSSAANYRAACRAKSRADFINKLKIVEEELDETLFFAELIANFNEQKRPLLRNIYKEAEELLRIVVSSINTCLKARKSI